MTSKENKRKYDKAEEVSAVTSKKRWAFGDYKDNDSDDGDNDSYSSSDEVSSKEEPAQRPRSDDGDTTDSENDDDNDRGSDDDNNDGSDDDRDDRFSNVD
jgi:hypothetical protein